MKLCNDDKSSLISIIVPVYKVEQYLDQCVESIINQTYRKLEIILVDDGSPDKCPTMCDEWAKRDKRIKVIHKKNGGLSDARNVGIANSTGDYIGFVDSDDWINSKMYERLLDRIYATQSDIASCGAFRVWDDSKEMQPMIKVDKECILNQHDAMECLIQSKYIIQTVWNKLYKAKLVKQVAFEKGKIHEDEFWSWQVIAKARRVATINENLYYYRLRRDSIMGNNTASRQLIVVDALIARHKFIQKNFPDLIDLDIRSLYYFCYYLGCQIAKSESGQIERQHLINLKNIIRQYKISKSYLLKQGIKKIIKLSFIFYNLPLISKMSVFLRIGEGK